VCLYAYDVLPYMLVSLLHSHIMLVLHSLQFHTSAQDVMDLTEIIADGVQVSLEETSRSLTLQALASRVDFPFVRLRTFDLLDDLESAQTLYAPIVNSSTVTDWENYVNEQKASLSTDNSESSTLYTDSTSLDSISSSIWWDQVYVQDDKRDYAPVWHNSPGPADPLKINYDLFSITVVRIMYNQLQTSLTMTSMIETPRVFKTDGPASVYMYPVLQRFRKDQSDSQINGGLVMAIVPWSAYLDVEAGEYGMTVVVDSSCGDSLTYTVRKDGVDFVGPSDLHRAEYDDLMIVGNTKLTSQTESGETCTYFYRMYPADGPVESFTATPIIMIVSTVGIMTLVGLLAYYAFCRLCLHKHDHDHSHSSFTKKVDEHYDVEEANGQTKILLRKSSQISVNAAAEDDSFGPEDSVNMDIEFGEDLSAVATVLSADILGFVEWSLSRQSSQEYTLVQTLHNAFDEIAKRRFVTVVDATSDCYIAVAGLSKVRDDHAEVMARFAWDCLVTSKLVFRQLEETLGEGTSNLKMRFGKCDVIIIGCVYLPSYEYLLI
jgi:Adenylate and Guanylate cyclase catalytic domain